MGTPNPRFVSQALRRLYLPSLVLICKLLFTSSGLYAWEGELLLKKDRLKSAPPPKTQPYLQRALASQEPLHLGLGVGLSHYTSQEPSLLTSKPLLALSRELNVAYHIDHNAIALGFGAENGEKNSQDLKSKLELRFVRLSWKYSLPLAQLLSLKSLSIEPNLGLTYLQARGTLADPFITLKDKADAFAFHSRLSIRLLGLFNIASCSAWLSYGLSYHNLAFKKFHQKFKPLSREAHLGVDYAIL